MGSPFRRLRQAGQNLICPPSADGGLCIVLHHRRLCFIRRATRPRHSPFWFWPESAPLALPPHTGIGRRRQLQEAAGSAESWVPAQASGQALLAAATGGLAHHKGLTVRATQNPGLSKLISG